MLLAIHGFKQSGKDTLADLLVSEYGYRKVAFADRLKEVLHLMFGVPKEQLWGSDEDKQQLSKVEWKDLVDIDKADKDDSTYLSVRELMQIFATEVCRSKIPDIWYKYLFVDSNDKVVISDLRFENEAEFLKTKKATLIKVKRPAAKGGHHQSEAGLSDEDINYVLLNDQDLEAFLQKGRVLFEELGLKKVI